MCFTPLASIVTAGTEFSIVGYLMKIRPSNRMIPLAVFVFLLGFYQFTEYALCTFSHPEFWAKVGFVTYTFVPFLGYHFQMNAAGKKIVRIFYNIPIALSVLAVVHPSFIVSSGCNLLHVSVHHLIFGGSTLYMALYLGYYFLFPGIGFFTYTNELWRRKKDSPLKLSSKFAITMSPMAILLGEIYFLVAAFSYLDPELLWWVQTSLVATIIITILGLGSMLMIARSNLFLLAIQCVMTSSVITIVILYALFPQFAYDFASIYCQFALLYGIAAIFFMKNGQMSTT